MSTGDDARVALARALAFLGSAQLPSGEFPVFASTDPTLANVGAPDPSIYPTALIAQCLAWCGGADPLRRRAAAFLADEMDGLGLWRHWTRAHPHHAQLPPDLDDTSCASAVLRAAGLPFPDNRPLLLANRDRAGLFFTWLAPRLRWAGLRHAGATWRQLAHAPTLWLFFRRTSAAPRDVDAVVNANTLFHLGAFEGDAAIVAWLARIVADGRERQCDKWYDDPFVVRYFLARALAGRAPEALATLAARSRAERPASALDAALAFCTRLCCGERPDRDALAALLAWQRDDGGWPRASLYHGGRPRLAGGGFGPPHPDTPHWGSEALTTGLCIEALARWLAGEEEEG